MQKTPTIVIIVNIGLHKLYEKLSKFNKSGLNNIFNCLSKCELENIQTMFYFKNGFDISLADISYKTLSISKVTMTMGTGLQSIYDKNIAPTEKSPSFNFSDFPETELLKILNQMCDEPEDITLEYYSSKDLRDKPLGKLLIELAYEKDSKCDSCKKPKANHFYYIFKKMGRIKIQFLQTQDDNLDTIMDMINRESNDLSIYNNFIKYENKKEASKSHF